MEVMGVNFCAGDVEGCDVLGFYVDYAVLVLEWPFNAQKPAASNNNAVTLENVRRNNHISNTRFVFEREEYETLRRARALPRDVGSDFEAQGDSSDVEACVEKMQYIYNSHAQAFKRIIRPMRTTP